MPATQTETHQFGVGLSLEQRAEGSWWTGPLAIAAALALVKFAIHLFTATGYGYFRDELYYIACSEHLDWGYVDHAPMVAWLLKLSHMLFGDSLVALRLFPAIAGALTVFLTGLIARELGGRRLAVLLSCLCVLVGGYLALDSFFSMNAFEPIFWLGSAYFIILVINRNWPVYWLGFGLLAGLGLENKHSMLFFGLGIFVGILLTPLRRSLLEKWFWIGGVLAILLFLPNVIWEFRHDWATLELLRNVQQTGKNVVLSPIQFLAQQALILNPATLPVWVAGLVFFLFDRHGRRYRIFGIAYLTVLALMLVLKGKNYYMMPIYPLIFAGGSVLLERWFLVSRYTAWLKVAYPVVLVVTGAVMAPFMVPILPVEIYLRYQDALGFKPPKTEVGHVGPLPQHFGDRFGWPEMVQTVAGVYNSLPEEERAKAAIYGNNYGEAGAIDFFGPKYGLPKAISSHQNYFLWGPRDYTGEVMILLQSDREDAEEHCDNVQEAGRIAHPYAMGEEHYTIFICRGLKPPLKELWPELKHWN
jgi:Dolichyl-phosphate-mannose-protein mannosyltransferase